MREIQTPAAIRATLQYVLGSEFPAEYKAIVIDALTHFLRYSEQEDDQRRVIERESRAWQPHEISHLDRSLTGKMAKSWQDADETLILISSQLHRRSAEVRAKALERGFTAALDFAAAKAALSVRDED
jgi:hypothetical protein